MPHPFMFRHPYNFATRTPATKKLNAIARVSGEGQITKKRPNPLKTNLLDRPMWPVISSLFSSPLYRPVLPTADRIPFRNLLPPDLLISEPPFDFLGGQKSSSSTLIVPVNYLDTKYLSLSRLTEAWRHVQTPGA